MAEVIGNVLSLYVVKAEMAPSATEAPQVVVSAVDVA